MRLLSVVGARPQFVKLAPIAAAAELAGVEHITVHTGQHYDFNMSQNFFEDLRIPTAAINLDVGSGTHGVQTGAMMAALDPVLEEYRPDWVLVYGDTNSTLAAAVCAKKLHLNLAHLEAGLRSYNRRMPEEHNRVVADHCSDVCLAPTELAMKNLAREGLAGRSQLVGDVMIDVLLNVAESVRRRPVDSPIPLDDHRAVLATIHRPDNSDDKDRLVAILDALSGVAGGTVYFLVHPRVRARCQGWGLDLNQTGVRAIDPLSYPQITQALLRAKAVVTDSGGLQKEAYTLGVPVTTIRAETEWPETLADGWNELVPDVKRIAESVSRPRPTTSRSADFGDGATAPRVINVLSELRHGV